MRSGGAEREKDAEQNGSKWREINQEPRLKDVGRDRAQDTVQHLLCN